MAVGLLGCPGDDPGMSSASAGSTASGGEGTDAPTGSTGSIPTTTTGGPGGGTVDDADDTAGTTDGEGTTTDSGEGSSDSSGNPIEPGPDLRLTGPLSVDTTSDTVMLPGCSMAYDLRVPAGMADAPAVVLAHGFQGNRGTMAGWAEHWASWGVRVITPNLCHATILDTDHPQNGDDLRALVDALALGPVIYAGYSAGGLAAVLAAAEDDQAVALVGLDMVDADGLGAAAAAGVIAPTFGVIGEPSQCNTTNNGLGVLQSAGGQVLRVTEADHCDFQSPADFLCGLTCTGTNAQFDEAAIAAAVRGLTTAAVVWQAGLEPTGVQWWTPGQPYFEELSAAGIVQIP